MKNIRRAISMLLCLVMVASCLTMPAAAVEEEPHEHVHDEAEPAAEITDAAETEEVPEEVPDEVSDAVPVTEPVAEPAQEPNSEPAADGKGPNITVSAAPKGGYMPENYNFKSGKDYTKFCLSDDVKVTVSDKDGLKSVKVGGEEKNFGEGEKEYVFTPSVGNLEITATDVNGNTSNLTITVYKAHDEIACSLTTKDADCVMSKYNGQTVYYCKNCGNARFPYATRPLKNPLKHDLKEETVKDSCGHAGTKQVCSRCGFAQMTEGSDIGNDYDHEWKLVVKPADHNGTIGSAYYECKDCGAVKDAVALSALGHMYPFNGTVIESPNCAEEKNGVTRYKCVLCDDSYERVIPWSHNWGGWESTKASDCKTQTNGEKVRHCKTDGCTASETAPVPYSHAWRYVYVIDVPSTCTSPGKQSYHCINCDTIKPGSQVEIPAQGDHLYIDADDDCTTKKTCKYCGIEDANDTEVKEKHDLVLMSDYTQHWYKCQNCGHTEGLVDHTWGEWKGKLESHTHTCTVCQKSETIYHDETHMADDGNCLTANVCPDCNYVFTRAQSGHAYTRGVYMADGEKHWYDCTNYGCSVHIYEERHKTASDADCTKGIFCEVCNHPLVTATGEHNWGEWEYNADKTQCTRACQTPGCTVTDTANHEHSFGDWESVDGSTHKRVCSVCGLEETGTHNASADDSCLTETKCELCGHVMEEKQDSHNMNWVQNADGTHTGKCQHTGCSYTVTEGHKFGEWTTDETSHTRTCTVCGATESGHHDAQEDGDCLTETKCSVCGLVTVAAKESHDYGPWTEVEDNYRTHRSVCRNPGCTSSREEDHTGTDDGDCSTPVYCDVCKMEYIRAKAHAPAGEFHYTGSDGHYQYCSNEGCEKSVLYAHTYVNDGDHDCTTATYCVTCDFVLLKGEEGHNWSAWKYGDERVHYRECENPDCSVIGEEGVHDGAATCAAPAHCTVCNSDYGEKDPENHTGETEVRNYKAPTETTEGYTGDTYCLGCEKVLSEGQVIPKLTNEHTIGPDWHSDSTHHWHECVNCRTRTDYDEHDFGDWQRDAADHYRVCKTCGYTQHEAHTPAEDDHDCTTSILCTVCGYAVTTAREGHNFTGPCITTEGGHHRVCQNPDCSQVSETEEHSGGVATCLSPAICEGCGAVYGEMDPENHIGGEVILGYRDPTEEITGYTGDAFCLSCGATIAQGRSIPTGEREHEFVTEYDENYCWKACKLCGYRESGSYNPHSYINVNTANGYRAYGDTSAVQEVCVYCGDINPYSGHQHAFGGFERRREPTCGDVGVEVATCHECGANFARELAPTENHNWVPDENRPDVDPTCAEPGARHFVCTICGEERTETIPATGQHTWDEGVVTVPARGEMPGEKEYTCTICGEKLLEEIPATGEHMWDEGVVVTPAGCVTEGVMLYTCTGCGVTRTEPIPSLGGHTWDEGTVTTPATCTEEGVRTFKCTVCGEERTEVIPSLGGHTWDEGTVTTPATCTEDGVRTFKCTVCGEERTEVIPATGKHVFENGKCTVCGEKEPSDLPQSPQTAQDVAAIFAAALIVAAAGVGAYLARRKKIRH